MKKGTWGTRFGFYLAAIGSAFGLGNIWRFPYIVSENGGGAFVLLYVFLAFIIGMPLLIGELLLGKVERKSIYSAMKALSQQGLHGEVPKSLKTSLERWILKLLPWIGKFSVFVCLLVLAYYAVISGWVLHYLIQLVAHLFYGGFEATTAINELLESAWVQVFYTAVHLILVTFIVAKDVEQGLEKFVGYMMPVFIILLLILAGKALSLETTPDALRFLFYPDFSELNGSSLGQALGHVFFTLSVGFGTMVTFGSYLRDKAFIPLAGFRVTMVDSIISLFSAVLIFPLALASSQILQGPDLLFRTVPVLVTRISGGPLFGVGFFLCLYLAALGASMGLLETITANLRDAHRPTRGKAVSFAAFLCFLFALVPALSSNLLSDIRLGERGLLEVLDAVIINWLLPIAALLISQVVLYFLKESIRREQFEDPESQAPLKLYSHWRFSLKWVVSPLILLALFLQLKELF